MPSTPAGTVCLRCSSRRLGVLRPGGAVLRLTFPGSPCCALPAVAALCSLPKRTSRSLRSKQRLGLERCTTVGLSFMLRSLRQFMTLLISSCVMHAKATASPRLAKRYIVHQLIGCGCRNSIKYCALSSASTGACPWLAVLPLYTSVDHQQWSA